MKVIKEPAQFVPFEQNCTSCGATLLVEEKDIRYKPGTGDQRDWEPEYYAACCIICFKEFRVEDAKVPRITRVKLERERTTVYDR